MMTAQEIKLHLELACFELAKSGRDVMDILADGDMMTDGSRATRERPEALDFIK